MQTSGRTSCLKLAHAACLILLFGLAWGSPAQAQTFGGRAFSAYVNVPAVGAGPLYLADTGQLLTRGGWESADLLSAEVPSALSANVLNSATVGGDKGNASSSSSLADVTVLPGNVAQLTASFVRSEALATATGTGGSAEIYDLTLGGVPVQVTGVPNQLVQIPGLLGPVGTLIINEQTVTSNATSQAITVNALHLILATGDEVILGSAQSLVNTTGQLNLADGRGRANPAGKVAVAKAKVAPARKVALADVRGLLQNVTLAGVRNGLTAPVVPAILPRARRGDYCAANTSPVTNLLWRLGVRPPITLVQDAECFDFITGGGFLFNIVDNGGGVGGRVDFGFNAGFKTDGTLQVHFNLVDQSAGRHLKVQAPSTPTSYVTPSSGGVAFCRCRDFSGPDSFSSPSATVMVRACDNATPGRTMDVLSVMTTDGYSATSSDLTIAGGNIELHKPCPPPPNTSCVD